MSLSATEATIRLASMWRDPQTDKSKYHQKAASLKAQFQKENATWRTEHAAEIQEVKRQRRAAPGRWIQHDSCCKTLHAVLIWTFASVAAISGPRRPATSFLQFCQVWRPRIMEQFPALSMTDCAKQLSAKWASLTPGDRAPFVEQVRWSSKRAFSGCQAPGI